MAVSWNRAVLDALNDLLVEAGIAEIPPDTSWNTRVLDTLGAVYQLATGGPLPTERLSWNSEFLGRLSAIPALIGMYRKGTDPLIQLVPADMLQTDTVGLLQSVTVDANKKWTIVLNAGGADEVSAYSPVSVNPTTGALFWFIPLIDYAEGERLSMLEVQLDLQADPGVPSNLRVCTGVATAIGSGIVLGTEYNFATGRAGVQVATSAVTQNVRTYALSRAIRMVQSFYRTTTVQHYGYRPLGEFSDPSDPNSSGVVINTNNFSATPNYFYVSIRPVGAIPATTTVSFNLAYRKHLRGAGW